MTQPARPAFFDAWVNWSEMRSDGEENREMRSVRAMFHRSSDTWGKARTVDEVVELMDASGVRGGLLAGTVDLRCGG